MAEARRTLGMGEQEAVEGHAADAPFGAALTALAAANPRIVGLTADLAKYTDIMPFATAYPERFFNVGMAEQNLVAMSAGLAKLDRIAFCTTYGVFATRRAYDFLAIACAHSRLNVKVFAGLPGLTTGYGGTHQAIEDTGLVRLIPGMAVIDPCDATEIAQVVELAAAHDGPFYVRLLRGSVPIVLDPAQYRLGFGKAAVLRAGRDVAIVSTGFMTQRALAAARALRERGVDAGVLHVPFLKPLDAAAIVSMAADARAVVTAENHVTSGGLASLVAEALFDAGLIRPIARIGLPDRFIECGSVPGLQEKYRLTAADITQAALGLLASRGRNS
jgi:transketolase